MLYCSINPTASWILLIFFLHKYHTTHIKFISLHLLACSTNVLAWTQKKENSISNILYLVVSEQTQQIHSSKWWPSAVSKYTWIEFYFLHICLSSKNFNDSLVSTSTKNSNSMGTLRSLMRDFCILQNSRLN